VVAAAAKQGHPANCLAAAAPMVRNWYPRGAVMMSTVVVALVLVLVIVVGVVIFAACSRGISDRFE